MAPPYWQLTVPVSESISEGLTNFVWELGALGVVEDAVLRAFFPPDVAPQTLRARVRQYLDGLRALGFPVDDAPPAVMPVADEAWAEGWKEHFRPIEIGARLLVAPPWNIPATARLTIVIEPGRAFGTGHHGSTAGCLVLIDRLTGREQIERALDLGTGSGILAIAAARLGVGDVLAVDNDPDAIAAAVANAARNGVPDRVRCAIADAEAAGDLPFYDSPSGRGCARGSARRRQERFPLVVANLLAPAHLRLAVRYAALVAPGGALLLGGILDREADGVAAALRAAGFHERERVIHDEWTSLLLHRNE